MAATTGSEQYFCYPEPRLQFSISGNQLNTLHPLSLPKYSTYRDKIRLISQVLSIKDKAQLLLAADMNRTYRSATDPLLDVGQVNDS